MTMKKLLIAVGLGLAAFVYIVLRGGSYNAELYRYGKDNAEIRDFEIEQDHEVIKIENLRMEDKVIKFTVTAVSPGKATVVINWDEYSSIEIYYVNRLGVVTESSRLGNCTGGNVLVLLVTVYAVILLGSFIEKLRKGLKTDYYNYHNITLLGVCIFISVFILNNVFYTITVKGLLASIRSLMVTASSVSVVAIPVAAIISIPVIISNISLMRHEGVTRKNLLGTFASVLFLVILLVPFLFDEWLQRQTLIDVHKESGLGNYLQMIVTNTVFAMVAYLVMILTATVIMGIAAARRTPAFDKDYILILGCRVRKDGTPTPLLKGRADAALRFAERQKQATGKDIIFVPSGGQGKDEVVSEAECISNYLQSTGVPKDRILVEDKSRNTYENFKFSVEKIKVANAKLAFATTGYHVFRSGFIASRNGIKADGVGAKTKAYFAVNAFIRELIATLEYEKKKHLTAVGFLVGGVVIMESILFLSIIY